jgi:hypothetical protein
MLGKTCVASCRDWDLSPSDFFSWFGRLGPGLRIAFLSQHLRDIATVGEDIGHEAIVDILAVRTLWKEFSVMPSLVTQQVLLFANPAVPELPGARVDDEATLT